MAAKKETEKKFSIEENFAKLQEIAALMGEEDISLEDSFKEYEKGVRLIRECSLALDEVEKKVMKLREDGTLEEFDV